LTFGSSIAVDPAVQRLQAQGDAHVGGHAGRPAQALDHDLARLARVGALGWRAGQHQHDLGLERREAPDRRAHRLGPLGGIGRAGERHGVDREHAGDARRRRQPGVAQQRTGVVVAALGELELPHADAVGTGLAVGGHVLGEGAVERRDLGDGELGIGHGRPPLSSA
jgi:hypothetical protein